mmetsp:Transcript_99620/g.277376  ORF Transcript_99620/g.277376 Transcript_99620/m.277376 type:complete len:124 (+) Transcript_99620:91-462(+)
MSDAVFEIRRYICFGVTRKTATISLWSYDIKPQGLNVRLKVPGDSDEFRLAEQKLKDYMGQCDGDIDKGYSWKGHYWFKRCPECDEQKKVNEILDMLKGIAEIAMEDMNPVNSFEDCDEIYEA